MENPTTKPKGALSAEARAKREVRVKIKLPGAYIRRRKQKAKTHRVSELSGEEIQSLSISLGGNPLSLAILPFLTISHLAPSFIYISS